MSYLPLTVTIEPVTHEEWTLALRRAPIGTKVSDRDGDIWTKLRGVSDEGCTWLRTNGGWADAHEVAEYAPLFEYKEPE